MTANSSRSEDVGDAARVLVIDDHPAILKLVKAFSGRAGLSPAWFHGVGGVSEAADWLRENVPELVLLDGRLPDIADFRDSLERLSGLYDGPIILLTGLVPGSLGDHAIDSRLHSAMSKDEIGNGGLTQLIADLLEAEEALSAA